MCARRRAEGTRIPRGRKSLRVAGGRSAGAQRGGWGRHRPGPGLARPAHERVPRCPVWDVLPLNRPSSLIRVGNATRCPRRGPWPGLGGAGRGGGAQRGGQTGARPRPRAPCCPPTPHGVDSRKSDDGETRSCTRKTQQPRAQWEKAFSPRLFHSRGQARRTCPRHLGRQEWKSSRGGTQKQHGEAGRWREDYGEDSHATQQARSGFSDKVSRSHGLRLRSAQSSELCTPPRPGRGRTRVVSVPPLLVSPPQPLSSAFWKAGFR